MYHGQLRLRVRNKERFLICEQTDEAGEKCEGCGGKVEDIVREDLGLCVNFCRFSISGRRLGA